MQATLDAERKMAADGKSIHGLEIFQGTLGWRFLIAGWPKITQQLVGLTVFNNYATYFCEFAFVMWCLVTSAHAQSNSRGTKIPSLSRSFSPAFSSSRFSSPPSPPTPLAVGR